MNDQEEEMVLWRLSLVGETRRKGAHEGGFGRCRWWWEEGKMMKQPRWRRMKKKREMKFVKKGRKLAINGWGIGWIQWMLVVLP
ncbi:hypothetical protein HanIR_Chr11g0530551 [Helianthus annuus]|nr:hypothetical protein HanIR_Chr11g0530551 [Helianthus annuus]